MNKKRTLTFVDFQNDFVAPSGILSFDSGKGDTKLIQKTQAFFKKMEKHTFSYGIITYDTHQKESYFSTPESKQFPLHCNKGSLGWQLAVDVNLIQAKIPYIQHLEKSTYDMWAESIHKPDSTIIQNTKEVVLFGVASDICNKAALEGWLNYDVQVIILEDLTRGIFKQTADVLKEPPFAQAVASGKIRTMNSKYFLKQIKERGYV